jgi:hypothetical protein
LAIDLETTLGLGRSGLARLPTDSARDLILRRDLHEAVQVTLDDSYGRARDLLVASRPTLEALAEALFEAGYLDRAEIEAVVAAYPLAPRAPVRGPHSGPKGPKIVDTRPGEAEREAQDDYGPAPTIGLSLPAPVSPPTPPGRNSDD